MKITTKGQVTIPIELRQKAGLLPNTEVVFEWDGQSLKILPAPSTGGSGRVNRLLGRLQGSATIRMTTDQIMAVTRGR